jgi:hypothetical protein
MNATLALRPLSPHGFAWRVTCTNNRYAKAPREEAFSKEGKEQCAQVSELALNEMGSSVSGREE